MRQIKCELRTPKKKSKKINESMSSKSFESHASLINNSYEEVYQGETFIIEDEEKDSGKQFEKSNDSNSDFNLMLGEEE